MLICGVDPGLRRTGYGIIEADGDVLKLVDAGLITPAVKATLADRLERLYEDIDGLFDDYPALSMVAVEELYSHYRHPRTAVLMAHARGVMLLSARRRGLAIVSLSATMVKKSLTGGGRAGKHQVQRAVISRLAIAPTRDVPDDVTDALALAICCFEHHRSIKSIS